MPKPLTQAPPTSSIARLLDLDAAARAVAAPSPQAASTLSTPRQARREEQPVEFARPPATRTGERPRLDRSVILTDSADRTLTSLVDMYRRATNSKVTSSHVVRALLRGVAHCMDELEREAQRIGHTRLPSNARGGELERERFEARIADAFVAGIRAAHGLGDEHQ